MKHVHTLLSEAQQTAANLNLLDPGDRQGLGQHLLAQYGHVFLPSLMSRVEGLAMGSSKVDAATCALLRQCGIDL